MELAAMTSRQRVEAKYPGAYCCVRFTTIIQRIPQKYSAELSTKDFIVNTKRGRIIGTGKTERAAWINAARGL